jgi:L-lactate dehydrogenase complex protein LldG
VGETQVSSREDILASIRARGKRTVPSPNPYVPPVVLDAVAAFAESARLANAEVRLVENSAAVPSVVADLLRSRNLPARVHVPAQAQHFPWHHAPGLTVESGMPGGEDAAIAVARHGIAETGTLAYVATPDAPPSWHFRPGFEIAVVRAEDILPHMEDVLRRLKKAGEIPSTTNFVTGPSRTGDIEQTLELGAHGPKALAILIIEN